MISYRSADILKRIFPLKEVIIYIDTSHVVIENSADYSVMHEYTFPVVLQNSLDPEEIEAIDDAIARRYAASPIYIGSRTIVNNDEGEFTEDIGSISAAFDRLRDKTKEVLEELGYRVMRSELNRGDLEVKFQVKGPYRGDNNVTQ